MNSSQFDLTRTFAPDNSHNDIGTTGLFSGVVDTANIFSAGNEYNNQSSVYDNYDMFGTRSLETEPLKIATRELKRVAEESDFVATSMNTYRDPTSIPSAVPLSAPYQGFSGFFEQDDEWSRYQNNGPFSSTSSGQIDIDLMGIGFHEPPSPYNRFSKEGEFRNFDLDFGGVQVNLASLNGRQGYEYGFNERQEFDWNNSGNFSSGISPSLINPSYQRKQNNPRVSIPNNYYKVADGHTPQSGNKKKFLYDSPAEYSKRYPLSAHLKNQETRGRKVTPLTPVSGTRQNLEKKYAKLEDLIKENESLKKHIRAANIARKKETDESLNMMKTISFLVKPRVF